MPRYCERLVRIAIHHHPFPSPPRLDHFARVWIHSIAMPFELHVWGPAFGLPSIDPDCIAAVAYFTRIVPQGQWTLIADYDTSISPQSVLSCDQLILQY